MTEVLSDGTIEFMIKDGPHDGEVCRVDVYLARLAIERVEAKHEVFNADGTQREGWQTTPEFMTDLIQALKSAGVAYCSGSMAEDLWALTAEAWNSVKKNTRAVRKSPSSTDSTPADATE